MVINFFDAFFTILQRFYMPLTLTYLEGHFHNCLISVVTNTQQTPLCRYSNVPTAFLSSEYSPAHYYNCSDMQPMEAKSVEPVPTGAVEQL